MKVSFHDFSRLQEPWTMVKPTPLMNTTFQIATCIGLVPSVCCVLFLRFNPSMNFRKPSMSWIFCAAVRSSNTSKRVSDWLPCSDSFFSTEAAEGRSTKRLRQNFRVYEIMGEKN